MKNQAEVKEERYFAKEGKNGMGYIYDSKFSLHRPIGVGRTYSYAVEKVNELNKEEKFNNGFEVEGYDDDKYE